jgi:hypothetical protein
MDAPISGGFLSSLVNPAMGIVNATCRTNFLDSDKVLSFPRNGLDFCIAFQDCSSVGGSLRVLDSASREHAASLDVNERQ